MKINSLEKMEDIVKKSPQLFWEGWTVCVYLDEDGFFSTDGVFKNEKWLTKRRFEYVGDGWNIPDRFVKSV